MATTKTKIIGTGSVATLIGIFLWFTLSSDFTTSTSKDIICSGDCINPKNSDCIGYFNVTAKSSYYFYNKYNKTIEFGKEVRSFDIGINDKRYKGGFRPFDFQTPFSKDVKYVLKLNKGEVRTFRVRICKNNPTDDVKFGMSALNFDPIFKGINVSINNFKSCLEETNYFNESKAVYGNITGYKPHYDTELVYIDNGTHIGWFNHTYENGTEIYNYYGITNYENIEKNKTECIRDTSYLNLNFGNKIILLNYSRYDFNCSNTDRRITCDSKLDGNGNGKLDTDLNGVRLGETYFLMNATSIIFDNSGDGADCKIITLKGIEFNYCSDKSLSKFVKRLEIE